MTEEEQIRDLNQGFDIWWGGLATVLSRADKESEEDFQKRKCKAAFWLGVCGGSLSSIPGAVLPENGK